MEYETGPRILFSNLSRLMANTPSAKKLRGIIIDENVRSFEANGIPRSLQESFQPILKSLNEYQRIAVLKALYCKEFCLIDGLPGTGKTHLIVALIRLAAVLRLSIFLTSFTHSAVDNVLLKLSQYKDVDFLRIGQKTRIHPSIFKYSADARSKNCTVKEELDTLFEYLEHSHYIINEKEAIILNFV